MDDFGGKPPIFGNIHLEVPLFFGNTQKPKGMSLQEK